MKQFYENGKSIIGFLIIVLVFSMITDESTTQKMVLLVLLGMALLNANAFTSFLKELK